MTSPEPSGARIGLIVNPIAGMGGAVGLKGTDGANLARARARNAKPFAAKRCEIALAELRRLDTRPLLVVASGAMGEDAARASGLPFATASPALALGDTGGTDTITCARSILGQRPDLFLFAGGDGTARDLLEVDGMETIPVIGIPSGVKMHSGAFASTARAAGILACRYLEADNRKALLRQVEIVDRPESDGAYAAPQLYGTLTSPVIGAMMPNPKARRAGMDDGALDAALRQRAAAAAGEEDILVVGPGATMSRFKGYLGDPGTLLGVDVFRRGEIVFRDATASDLEGLGGDIRIVVSPTGGQGFLFGRGNQQISAKVLKRAGRDRIEIFAAAEKLSALPGARLFVDTGDVATDLMLAGHWKAVTGPRRRMIVHVPGPDRVA